MKGKDNNPLDKKNQSIDKVKSKWFTYFLAINASFASFFVGY